MGGLGARGWGYRNCLPYFRKSETFAGGGDEYRGGDGPLHVTSGNNMANPLYRAFVAAGDEAGYSRPTIRMATCRRASARCT